MPNRMRFTLMEILVVIALLLLLVVAVTPMFKSTLNYFSADELKGKLQQQCERAEWFSRSSGRQWRLTIVSNEGAGMAQLEEIILEQQQTEDETIPDFDSSAYYDFDGNSRIKSADVPKQFLKELPSPLILTDQRSGEQVDEAVYTFFADGSLTGPDLKMEFEDYVYFLKPDRLRGFLNVLDPDEAETAALAEEDLLLRTSPDEEED